MRFGLVQTGSQLARDRTSPTLLLPFLDIISVELTKVLVLWELGIDDTRPVKITEHISSVVSHILQNDYTAPHVFT